MNGAVRYAICLNREFEVNLEDKKIEVIFVGSNMGDMRSDNSPEYWKKKTEEVNEGLIEFGQKLQIKALFQELGWDKKDMVTWFNEYNIPIHKSWSCWFVKKDEKGTPKHCGECEPCERRKEAYKLAGVEDLTGYLV
jgi:7-cyano-7-deazaguanine synthase